MEDVINITCHAKPPENHMTYGGAGIMVIICPAGLQNEGLSKISRQFLNPFNCLVVVH